CSVTTAACGTGTTACWSLGSSASPRCRSRTPSTGAPMRRRVTRLSTERTVRESHSSRTVRESTRQGERMTFSIKTDEGVCIGAAETLVCGSPRPAVGPFGRGSLRIDTVQSNLETVTLGGYQPTRQVEGLELKVKDLESEREFWRELFNRLVDQRDEHAALAEARGKTIHELTEKFREKKERIHAFYAPQLENRKAENEELERVARFAEAESASADYWFGLWKKRAAGGPVHASVIQEHEE